jgi:hypothetical protein
MIGRKNYTPPHVAEGMWYDLKCGECQIPKPHLFRVNIHHGAMLKVCTVVRFLRTFRTNLRNKFSRLSRFEVGKALLDRRPPSWKAKDSGTDAIAYIWKSI